MGKKGKYVELTDGSQKPNKKNIWYTEVFVTGDDLKGIIHTQYRLYIFQNILEYIVHSKLSSNVHNVLG